jgi:hypothetical protein
VVARRRGSSDFLPTRAVAAGSRGGGPPLARGSSSGPPALAAVRRSPGDRGPRDAAPA